MRYGDLVVTTAIYRTQCACDVTLELARGQECPSCPRCESAVEWTYQRSTFRPLSEAAVEPSSAPARPAIRITAP